MSVIKPITEIHAPTIRVPPSEITFTYARSSGPGGQNVNKVNSKAVLRWSILESPSLTEATRSLLLNRLITHLTDNGEIVLSSDRFRDQGRNREDCLEKLQTLLAQALEVQKARKKTKPSRSSQRRRMNAKSKHAEKKKHRREKFD